MKSKMLTIGISLVLVWATANVMAQGKGQGKERASRPAERKASAAKPADSPQPDTNVPAGKANQERPKGKTEPSGKKMKAVGGEQVSDQPKGKPAKESLAGKKEVAGKDEGGKGKGHQQQLQAFQKQLQHEMAKHMQRQARLSRIRALAAQKGDTEAVARVDKLIAKEQQVYDRKLQQMQEQERGTPGGTVLPDAKLTPGQDAKAKGKSDPNRPAKKADQGAPEQSKTDKVQDNAAKVPTSAADAGDGQKDEQAQRAKAKEQNKQSGNTPKPR